MPPKRQGPTTESTSKRPRGQGSLCRIHKPPPVQSIANQSTAPPQTMHTNPITIDVPQINVTTSDAQEDDGDKEDNDHQDHALDTITRLRREGHATAIGEGPHRKQYSREFKLAALTYLQEQSKPFPGPGLSKYTIAKHLQISEKMLIDWITKENTIVAMHANQKRATTGREALLPDMENYLHARYLEARDTGVKINHGWFTAEGKLWYEANYPEKVLTDGRGTKTFIGFKFSRPWFSRFKKRKGISLQRITNQAQQVPKDSEVQTRSFQTFIQKHTDPVIMSAPSESAILQ